MTNNLPVVASLLTTPLQTHLIEGWMCAAFFLGHSILLGERDCFVFGLTCMLWTLMWFGAYVALDYDNMAVELRRIKSYRKRVGEKVRTWRRVGRSAVTSLQLVLYLMVPLLASPLLRSHPPGWNSCECYFAPSQRERPRDVCLRARQRFRQVRWPDIYHINTIVSILLITHHIPSQLSGPYPSLPQETTKEDKEKLVSVSSKKYQGAYRKKSTLAIAHKKRRH